MDRLAQISCSLTPQIGCPVLLSGSLGVGKSTLARFILARLSGIKGPFPSPSFPLMLPYAFGDTTLWHMDLYRLNDVQQLSALDLPNMVYGYPCLIEWPEILLPFIAQSIHVSLDFGATPETRNITIKSSQTVNVGE